MYYKVEKTIYEENLVPCNRCSNDHPWMCQPHDHLSNLLPSTWYVHCTQCERQQPSHEYKTPEEAAIAWQLDNP